MKIFCCVAALLMFGMFDADGREGARGRVETFELKPGREKLIRSAGIRIKLVEVAEDSRCPQGVNCIWAGNVRVVLRIKAHGRSTRLEKLNSATEPMALALKGRRLSISKVSPSKLNDQKIKPEDYIVTLTLSAPPK
ncbi:MAG: hypothetical protein LC802_00360 [Acidobacteria bacterium]|nr:hypothetical protein [Acidobacteriota bacterium]